LSKSSVVRGHDYFRLNFIPDDTDEIDRGVQHYSRSQSVTPSPRARARAAQCSHGRDLMNRQSAITGVPALDLSGANDLMSCLGILSMAFWAARRGRS
jgi:hypothetical protein